MPSSEQSFKPDTVIRARKGDSSWTVAANERTRIMVPHFLDRLRWEGIGWPLVVAPGAVVTVVADCVWFGQGSGVDITVSDSEGTFEKTVHKTVCGDSVKHSVCVPDNARGLLLVKVAIPEGDRADWDAGLEDEDVEDLAPAVSIVPSLLQQVTFDKEDITEGDDVSITVQTSRNKERFPGSFDVGRLERYGGQDLFIRHAGPIHAYPEKAGGMEATWNVTTPMIDRRDIWAQWQINAAKKQAKETGNTYRGPAEYRGIELIARAKHLGLQSDSTEASRTGPDWTGTLTVLDALDLCVIDDATGAPYPHLPVDLILPDGSEESVTTGENGTISLEAVPPGPVRATLTLEDREQAPSPDATANLPNDAEVIRACWNRTEPTATAEVTTGTPQVLRMQFPSLST